MKFWLYLKIFLATSIPFGLTMSVPLILLGIILGSSPNPPVSMTEGAIAGLGLGILIGILFGSAMAIFGGTLHFMHSDSSRVTHRIAFFIGQSFADARESCVNALRQVPNVKIDRSLSDESTILANKGLTWRSWGDTITCHIYSISPLEQEINIESRPSWRFTLVDYGSNQDNIMLIEKHLLDAGAKRADSADSPVR